jgi:hypothetical protein
MVQNASGTRDCSIGTAVKRKRPTSALQQLNRESARYSGGRYVWGMSRDCCQRRLRSAIGVRRDNAALSSGCKPHPAIRSSRKQPERHGGDEMAEAFG